MKKLIYIILILVVATNIIEAQGTRWKRLLPKDTYEVWVNKLNYNTIFVGGGGRVVYRSYDAGITWDTLVLQYKGGASQLNNLIMHPVDTNIVLVGGLVFGDVRRTSDGGETWDIVISSLNPITLNGKSMIYDPHNPDIMYVGDYGYGRLFKSYDAGATWDTLTTIMKDVVKTDSAGHQYTTQEHVYIGGISIREDSTNVLLCGSTSGEMFISQDSGKTWKFTDQLQKPPIDYGDCEITRIDFSPRDPKLGYVSITYLFGGNLPNGGLFRTTDGGYNWDLLAFADTSLWAVACREYEGRDELFVGGYTEMYWIPSKDRIPGVGLIRGSFDGGKTWYNYDNQMDWYDANIRSNCKYQAIYMKDTSQIFICGTSGVIKERELQDGSGRWYDRSIYGISNVFYGIDFSNDTTGYICGEGGAIYKSTNLGGNWTLLSSGTGSTLYSIKFIDENNGIAVGENGNISKTYNAGQNWSKKDSKVTTLLKKICTSPDNTLFVAGNSGVILRSTDQGNNWTKVSSNSLSNLRSINFPTNNVGYAVGINGTVLKSTDAGLNWNTLVYFPTTDSLNDVHFLNNDLGYIAAEKGWIYKTVDGGQYWTKVNVYDTMKTMNVIHFFNESIGMTAGELGYIMVTNDGGLTWEISNYGPGPLANTWSLRYFGDRGNEKLYYANEAGLFVLETPTGVVELEGTKNDNSYLSVFATADRYMNVKYQKQFINEFQPIQLKIVDLLGNTVLVRTLNNNSEWIEDNFSIHSLANGTYLLQVIESGKSTTKMFVVTY